MRILVCLLPVVLLVGSVIASDEPAGPVREVKNLDVKENAFLPAKPLMPLVLNSAEKAARYLTDQGVATLKKQVDFEKQVVLLFAWQGSGQDQLTYEVAESKPEQIAFHREPGRTRDLRPHVHGYVLAAEVKWTVDGIAPVQGLEEVPWEEMKEIIKAEEVETVMQTHSRRVTVFLKDGRKFVTTEPTLDLVIRYIQELGKEIPIATE